MSKKDEALKLALEIALEKEYLLRKTGQSHVIEPVITAIREARAEQQPCKYPHCSYPCPDLPDCRDAEQPAQQQPLAGLLSITRRHPDGKVVTVSFKTLDAAIAFEQYALDVAHSTKEQP